MSNTRIRQYRRAADITQDCLAKTLGLKQAHLSQIERGTKQPSVPILKALSNMFGVTIDELVGHTLDPQSEDRAKIIAKIKELEAPASEVG